jgi:hypothetical protein
VFGSECKPNPNSSRPHDIWLAMSLVATSAVVGARASQCSSSASCSSRLLPAVAHRARAYRSLMTPAAAGTGRARLQVRAARLESTGVSVGFRAPQFEVGSTSSLLATNFLPAKIKARC